MYKGPAPSSIIALLKPITHSLHLYYNSLYYYIITFKTTRYLTQADTQRQAHRVILDTGAFRFNVFFLLTVPVLLAPPVD